MTCYCLIVLLLLLLMIQLLFSQEEHSFDFLAIKRSLGMLLYDYGYVTIMV